MSYDNTIATSNIMLSKIRHQGVLFSTVGKDSDDDDVRNFNNATTTSRTNEQSSKNKTNAMTTTPTPSRRRRHKFLRSEVDHIPSFHDFQQQIQVRTLYRKFLRLIRERGGIEANNELKAQIKHNFRISQSDNWNIKRAISEGNRRYKELSTMLGISVKDDKNATNQTTSSLHNNESLSTSSTNWPWNNKNNRQDNDDNKSIKPPPPFPKNLDK